MYYNEVDLLGLPSLLLLQVEGLAFKTIWKAEWQQWCLWSDSQI
jgi:hypothetical protein